MKLSKEKRSTIIGEILESLFVQPEKDLQEKQDILAKDMWEYEIQPYQKLLASVPDKFYKQEDRVSLRFKDARQESTKKGMLKRRLYLPQPVLVTTSNLGWESDPNVGRKTIDAFLDRITDLLIAQDKLAKERGTLRNYLKESINSVNTTKQLKGIWDEVFHKFIPIDPPRIKKATVETTLSSDLPDIDKVKGRMVDNLLKAS